MKALCLGDCNCLSRYILYVPFHPCFAADPTLLDAAIRCLTVHADHAVNINKKCSGFHSTRDTNGLIYVFSPDGTAKKKIELFARATASSNKSAGKKSLKTLRKIAGSNTAFLAQILNPESC